LLDEPGLFVFSNAAAAQRGIEVYDVDLIRAAFDDHAVPYWVDWIRQKPQSNYRRCYPDCVAADA
jgi:hypothetical protein